MTKGVQVLRAQRRLLDEGNLSVAGPKNTERPSGGSSSFKGNCDRAST